MMRDDFTAFRSDQLPSYRDKSQIGKFANYMFKEGYLEKVRDSNRTKYKFTEDIREELEEGRPEKLGDLMAEAKQNWYERFKKPVGEDYNFDDLKEDLSGGLFISETNRGKRKIFERKGEELAQYTKEYLEEISLVDSSDNLEVKVDEVDINMLVRYFEENEKYSE